MNKTLAVLSAVVLLGAGCQSDIEVVGKIENDGVQPQFELVHNKSTGEYFLLGAKGMDCGWEFTADHGWGGNEKTSGDSHSVTQQSDWPKLIDVQVTCINARGETKSDRLLEYSEAIGIAE